MKILTCIKQVRDLDIILSNDWVVEDGNNYVDVDYANLIMNTYDETALEMMLRFAEESYAETIALTIGGTESDKVLKKALALKTKMAIRIDKIDVDFSPVNVANIIRESIIKLEDVQLVLCGRQASIGDNGQTGLILAEMLGWPCISLVTDLKYSDGNIRVIHQVEGGLETLLVKPPLILTVTNSPDKFLRMATIKDVLSAKNKEISVWNFDDLYEIKGFELKRMYTKKQNKQCKIINDAEQLFEVLDKSKRNS